MMTYEEKYIATVQQYIAESAQSAYRKPVKEGPFTLDAIRLWYQLLQVGERGYIDTYEDDDPTDAPNYIAVIERFLEERKMHE